MSPDDTASLIYIGIVLLLLAGSFLMVSRGRLGAVLTQAAIWVLLFLGVIAAYDLWPEIREAVLPQQVAVVTPDGPAVEVPRAMDGHYYLELVVNDAPITFTVDTGATEIVLSREDALRAGIDPDDLTFLGTALTANGEVRTARVRLDRVALGGVTEADVPAVVTDGDLRSSLLGMTYLGGFTRIEIEGDRLRLLR